MIFLLNPNLKTSTFPWTLELWNWKNEIKRIATG